ncbi:hypothetical protein AAG589_17425 [Isoptericola sp. F-RaC21]|uniref:hypothetical protein n=1 Tax=Isoptericola sp. F-RaC21 TaxID=3141452 RepID=UPI00315BEA48
MSTVVRSGGASGGASGGGLDGDLCPLTGSPPALVDAADAAARAAERLAHVRVTLLRVRATLDGQRSTAVERARERVTTLADDARASGGMLEASAGTLRRHAVALGEAQLAAERALADRAEALGREARWRAEADEARRSTWNIPGVEALGGAPLVWPGTVPPLGGPGQAHHRLAAAERAAAAARAEVVAAEARWRAARDAKAEASRRAAAALAALADVRAVRAVTAAGADPAALVASGNAARQVAALLPRAGSGGDDAARRELREDVRRVLTAHADDPAFWAVFWDTASPQDLYLALGPSYVDPTRPVSAELHGALSQGTADWARTASDDELREFGHGVVAGVGDWPLGLAERSQLAAALLPAGLPAAAHAAAGDALDARWWVRADEEARGAGTAGAPGDLAGDALVDATLTAPLAAAVLAGYARHPRLALDRLAPASDGQGARAVRRWFGWAPRDGWPDGGRAAAGALAAAVDEGTSSPHQADQRRATMLVSRATKELPSGLLSGPTLDDRASADIARAYEPYLPSMGDDAREQKDGDTSTSRASGPAPGIDDTYRLTTHADLWPAVPQPELDAFALRDVIAATSRTPGAADAWLGATDRYTASMVELAATAADGGSAARLGLAQDAISDVGAVAGSMRAELLDAAYDRVETREQVIALASGALGIGTLGRSTAEAVGATAATQGLAFLDTRGPIVEARAALGEVKEQTFVRYGTTMHDLLVAHDIDRGIPAEEAITAHRGIDPEYEDETLSTLFDETFEAMSETPRTEDR